MEALLTTCLQLRILLLLLFLLFFLLFLLFFSRSILLLFFFFFFAWASLSRRIRSSTLFSSAQL
jgi:hypothetical protein